MSDFLVGQGRPLSIRDQLISTFRPTYFSQTQLGSLYCMNSALKVFFRCGTCIYCKSNSESFNHSFSF